MTIPHVADNDTIATAWGNAVADDVNALNVQLPRVLGYMGLTATFTTVAPHTTYQDEGLTVTVTEPAGRPLRITLGVNLYPSGGIAHMGLQILRNGVVVREWTFPGEAMATGTSHGMTLQHVILSSGAGGSGVVYKTQIKSFAATAVTSWAAGASTSRFILVEQIGAL